MHFGDPQLQLLLHSDCGVGVFDLDSFQAKAYDGSMKKRISAFVAGAVLASVPYLLLTRADAQGAGPARAQGGAIQGGPAQLPPGQGFPGGAPQGVPPISSFQLDSDYIYAAAGNWIYKITKNDMRVVGRVSVAPQQRQERPPRPDGNESN